MLSLSPNSVPSFILSHVHHMHTSHLTYILQTSHTTHIISHSPQTTHLCWNFSHLSMMHQIPSGCIVESVGARACEVLWGRGRRVWVWGCEGEGGSRVLQSVGVRMWGREECAVVRMWGWQKWVCVRGCMLERGRRVWGVRMCGRGKSVGRWRSKEGNTKLADLECEVVRVWSRRGRGSSGKEREGATSSASQWRRISSVPVATWSRELTRMEYYGFFHRAECIKDLEDNNHFWLTVRYSLVPRLFPKRGNRVCCS